MSPSPANKYRILADENLHRDIAKSLTEAGHDVAFTPKGLKNGHVYRAVIDSKRMLLTGDRDFLNVKMYSPANTHGIIVIKIHPPDPAHVMPVLSDTLSKLSPNKIKSKLIVLQASGFWIETA